MTEIPETVLNAIAADSAKLPDGSTIIRGYDFESPTVDYNALLSSYLSTGFQASHFGQGIQIVNNMVCRQLLHFFSPALFSRLILTLP